MIVTDETIYQALTNTNMWGQVNHYMFAQIPPSLAANLMYGAFAPFVEKIQSFVVNQNENGIFVLPVDGDYMYGNAFFIPQNNIAKIIIKKELFFRMFTVVDCNNNSFSFKVVKKVFSVKKHSENVQEFMKYAKMFPNK